MQKELSVARLRVGVFFFALFWLPAYLLVPATVALFGYGDDPEARRRVTAAILLIQGALGIIGFLMIGKTVALLLKKSSFKKIPKLIWQLFWSGHVPTQAR